MAKSITICAHCVCTRLSQYAVFLRYQLSSLVLYPPKVDYQYICITHADDWRTKKVLKDFQKRLQGHLSVLELSMEQLSRRAIGRNLVALGASTDLVFFTDVDYFFGLGCLDEICHQREVADGMIPKPVLIWPHTIMHQSDPKMGDQLIKQHRRSHDVLDINYVEYIERHYRRAIGGVQIVPREFAVTKGYLNKHRRWQKPPTNGTFLHTEDDVHFRIACHNSGPDHSFPLLSIYRLRHTENSYQKPGGKKGELRRWD